MMVKVRPKHRKDFGDNNFKDVSSAQVNELRQGGGAVESGQSSVVELFRGTPSPFTA